MTVDHIKVGKELRERGLLQDSINHFQSALKLNPQSYEALEGLGITLSVAKQYEAALVVFKQALKINPNSAAASDHIKKTISELVQKLHMRAISFKDIARMDDSVACLKRALELDPDQIQSHHLLLLLMVASSTPPEEQAECARRFGERFANPLYAEKDFSNNKDPDRKLRIGYVSPNFCHHPVNYFFRHLLDNHDKSRFEIFAYSNTHTTDKTTEDIKGAVDHWRDIRELDDETACDLIEKDQIDILIDMAGHTLHNRLLVFARRPAPIQATWLGHPATTGMRAMDYRITDIHAEPPGMTEHLNVEALCRLPEIFCCYEPKKDSPNAIDHPPFEDNGYITFGCFNNFAKVNETVLKTWARILERVPNSRLFLEIQNINHPDFYADLKQRFINAGLPLERITLELASHSNQYVLYNKIDIALDPFPCVGGTTSMDTVWMGVPFVTLAGKQFVSRMGVTILTNAGLKELIAEDIDQYVEIASTLANDKERLKKLRHGLREKVKASPIMDQKSFATNLENAYRGMWAEWVSAIR